MKKFLVEKSKPLSGEVCVDGSKNSALPILAAALLGESTVKLENIPDLTDTDIMCKLLKISGAKIKRNFDDKTIEINAGNLLKEELPTEYVQKIRASFLLAAPLLVRNKSVRIQMPGGCPIGIRPIDLHLKGFLKLGAKISQCHGVIEISCEKLKGSDIHLDFPSVGATENIIMAACFAEGETTLTNCAVEPEIVDLAEFLSKMNCKITGAGTDTIHINGIKCAEGCCHKIIPDRIEAGTFMAAAVATRGKIKVNNVCCEHLKAVTAKLREMNADIKENGDSITVDADRDINSAEMKTMPFPGFPTDMQPQLMAIFSSAKGTGVINETIFENRFIHVSELNRMGADIKVSGSCAIVNGVSNMTGAEVTASDLRGGAGLVIAAMCAEGESIINGISNIERGYCRFDRKLCGLGAKIRLI